MLDDQYGDYTHEDLPDWIGKYQQKHVSPDGRGHDKCREYHLYETLAEDGDQLVIRLRENDTRYRVRVMETNDGAFYTTAEDVGRFGYLGQAVEAAERAVEPASECDAIQEWIDYRRGARSNTEAEVHWLAEEFADLERFSVGDDAMLDVLEVVADVSASSVVAALRNNTEDY